MAKFVELEIEPYCMYCGRTKRSFDPVIIRFNVCSICQGIMNSGVILSAMIQDRENHEEERIRCRN